ncbi:hypothetical protein GCM10028784_36940 [Myceligenerans cantabricum]
MSMTTTESVTSIAAGEPRTLLDALVEAGALIGRLGQHRVMETHVHAREVRIFVKEDAWAMGTEAGLPGRKLDHDMAACEVHRVAFGYDAANDLYIELRGDVLPSDDVDGFLAQQEREAAVRRAETDAILARSQAAGNTRRAGWTDRD